jgi:toxin ParE1/3/4
MSIPKQFSNVNEFRKDYRRCVCGVVSIYFRIENNSVEMLNL